MFPGRRGGSFLPSRSRLSALIYIFCRLVLSFKRSISKLLPFARVLRRRFDVFLGIIEQPSCFWFSARIWCYSLSSFLFCCLRILHPRPAWRNGIWIVTNFIVCMFFSTYFFWVLPCGGSSLFFPNLVFAEIPNSSFIIDNKSLTDPEMTEKLSAILETRLNLWIRALSFYNINKWIELFTSLWLSKGLGKTFAEHWIPYKTNYINIKRY